MAANECAKNILMCNAAISVHHCNIRNIWYRFQLIISLLLYQQLPPMKFSIEIKYYHPELKIGLETIKNVWLLSDLKDPVELKTVIHQGNLYYRLPQSGRRISYRTLKRGLIKKNIRILLPEILLPF